MFQDIAIDVAFRGYGLGWDDASPEALVEAARARPRPLDRVERETFDAALDFALRRRALGTRRARLEPEPPEPPREVDDEDLVDDPAVDPPEAWDAIPTTVVEVRVVRDTAEVSAVALAFWCAIGLLLTVSVYLAH